MSVETLIPIGALNLPGVFDVPDRPRGIVVLAWGSPQEGRDSHDEVVASCFRELDLATLLVDVVTPEESMDDETGLTIEIVGARLAESAAWASSQPGLESLPVGMFGAGTGAAASLRAAADRPLLVEAVVSHDGRLDLATDSLPFVFAPALLLVHDGDDDLLDINRQATASVGGEVRVEVIPQDEPLLDETGGPGRVIHLAGEWFTRHLRAAV